MEWQNGNNRRLKGAKISGSYLTVMEFFKRYKQDESREAEGSGVIGYGGRGGGGGRGVGRNRNEEVESLCFQIQPPCYQLE